jgi:hypothetical protein
MESIFETLKIKWLRVLGFATTDGTYCLDCINIGAVPDDDLFETIYDRDYPDGFTCVECCDVVTGETNGK